MFNSQTIPAWFVAITMIMTGVMWLFTIGRKIRVDVRAFAITFIIQGAIFGIVYQLFSVDIETRGFISRLMMVILSLSQFIPLAVSYFRSIK